MVTWSRLTNILLSGVAFTVQSLFISAPSHFMIWCYCFFLLLFYYVQGFGRGIYFA